MHQHEVGRAGESETANGVFVRRVRISGRAVFTPLAPLFLRSLNRTIEERDPDILHLHLPNPSAFWCLFSKSARERPWIIHWHSDVIGETSTWPIRLLYPIYRIFERALIRRANRVICTSTPYMETSAPLSGFKNKCSSIPLGIPDNKEITRRRHETLLEGQRPLKVICVGRLTFYKGHTFLINAVHDLPNVHLQIIGSGELESELRREIRKLKLTDRVELLTSLDNTGLFKLLSAADLLCLPSIERSEAFGLVILEAARASLPALVTNVKGSGMAWVVCDHETGRVVEPRSSGALKTVLEEIQANHHWLNVAGKSARRRFETNFVIEKAAGSIFDIYKQCGCNWPLNEEDL